MFGRAVCAVIVAIVVGLVSMFLLGPIFVGIGVPIAVMFGGFLLSWGWTIGVLAGLWYFFAGT